MKVLFIITEAPYGNEKMYNALRLAHQLKKSDTDTDTGGCTLSLYNQQCCSRRPQPQRYHSRQRPDGFAYTVRTPEKLGKK